MEQYSNDANDIMLYKQKSNLRFTRAIICLTNGSKFWLCFHLYYFVILLKSCISTSNKFAVNCIHSIIMNFGAKVLLRLKVFSGMHLNINNSRFIEDTCRYIWSAFEMHFFSIYNVYNAIALRLIVVCIWCGLNIYTDVMSNRIVCVICRDVLRVLAKHHLLWSCYVIKFTPHWVDIVYIIYYDMYTIEYTHNNVSSFNRLITCLKRTVNRCLIDMPYAHIEAAFTILTYHI